MSKEYNEHELDETLRAFLSAELDGQLGRAGQAFEEHLRLAHPAVAAAAPAARRGRTRATGAPLWVIGALGTAVAASIGAAVWVAPVGQQVPDDRVALTHTRPATPEEPTAPGRGGSAAVVAQATGPAAAPTETPAEMPAAPRWEQVEQLVSTVTLDNGPVVLEDNTPARLIRRVALERTEWVDEQAGVRVRAVVPRDDVQLIALDTY